jgi:IS5 family transposase
MASDDFFRSRLDQMIDLRHPLAVLATRMPWERIEAALAPIFAHKNRPGKTIASETLFGTTVQTTPTGPSRGGASAPADSTDGLAALPQAHLQSQ